MTPTNPNAPTFDPNAASAPPAPNLLSEPTFEECIAHHSRYFDDLAAGRIDLRDIPEGHYIAYYEGQIRDHDADSIALQQRVAAALGIHWARVFINYPWAW